MGPKEALITPLSLMKSPLERGLRHWARSFVNVEFSWCSSDTGRVLSVLISEKLRK